MLQRSNFDAIFYIFLWICSDYLESGKNTSMSTFELIGHILRAKQKNEIFGEFNSEVDKSCHSNCLLHQHPAFVDWSAPADPTSTPTALGCRCAQCHHALS